MPRSFFNPRRALAPVVVVLVGLSFLPASASSVVAGGPQWVLIAALSPGSWVVRVLTDPLREERAGEEPWRGRRELLKEYPRALRLIDQLQEENRRLKQRVRWLLQSSKLFEREAARLVPARVTGYRESEINPTIILNRGAGSGLKKGQAAIWATHLIGRVEAVGPTNARVRLITAADTNLAVRITPPDVDELARTFETRIGINPRHDAFTAHLGNDQPVREGDLARLVDGLWPEAARSAVVGKVTHVEKWEEDPLNYQRIVVKPMVSLRGLDRVVVLVPP